MAGKRRYNLFFGIRVALLAIPLAIAVGIAWALKRHGSVEGVLQRLLVVHDTRIARSREELEARQVHIARVLVAPDATVGARIEALEELAELGLARRKSFEIEGLSVRTGEAAAESRWVNHDNTDLHRLLPAVRAALEAGDARLRLAGAYALAQLQLEARHAEVVRVLERLLAAEISPALFAYVASALGDIGPTAAAAAPRLLPLLAHPEPRVAASAARALARMGPAAFSLAAERRLVAVSHHLDPLVREHVLEALGAIGAYSTVARHALRDALEAADPRVRIVAALALSDLGNDEDHVVELLAGAFELPPRSNLYVDDFVRDRRLKQRAADHLEAHGRVPDAVLGETLTFIRSTDDFMRKEAAIVALAGDGVFSPARADALLALLQEPRLGVYYAVVDGLAAMGPSVGDRVAPLLEHPRSQVRELAAQVLTRIGYRDASAQAALARNLASPDARVRVASIGALVEAATDREYAASALVTALDADPVAAVKVAAAEGLTALGDPAAFDAALRWAGDDDARIRRAALTATLASDPNRAEAARLVVDRLGAGDFDVIDAMVSLGHRAGPLGRALIGPLEREQDVHRQERLVDAMAASGDPIALDHVLANADRRLFYRTMRTVAVERLVMTIRFPADGRLNPEARSHALRSLARLQALAPDAVAGFLAEVDAPDLGDRVEAQVRAQVRAREPAAVRGATKAEQVRALYADLDEPQHAAVVAAARLLVAADGRTRERGVRALHRLLPEAVEAPTYLVAAIGDPDERVVSAALGAYVEAELLEPALQPRLEALLLGENSRTIINELAALSLARAGDAGLEVLLAASHRSEVAVRRAAVLGLLRLGQAAAPARGRLEELSKDPHAGVRTYAEKALAALEEGA